MNETQIFAITLYVPDATLRELRNQGPIFRHLGDGAPELDFLCPAWWEVSHTVRLGLLASAGAQGGASRG
ncbi:MAG: hypothetical protein HYY24_22570 [Verrucomicrobia bacterium]|nr:hypothetical protein [Verrucomicrobiota bacterium]